jgi:hypothetical protein
MSFRFIVDDVNYKVGYEHRSSGAGRYTLCCIYEEDSYLSASHGWARCSLKDQFNKKIGRKIAFTRALYLLFPRSKFTRKLVWEQFLKSEGINNGKNN